MANEPGKSGRCRMAVQPDFQHQAEQRNPCFVGMNDWRNCFDNWVEVMLIDESGRWTG